jgi:hypothetical protein
MAKAAKAFKCTDAQWGRAATLLANPPEALRVILATHRNPSISTVLKAALESGLVILEREAKPTAS